jgi:hypothetical protein
LVPDTTIDIQFITGGTAIIVRPPLSCHISKRHIDPMGRWAGVTLSLKGRAPITVISTYQPVTTQNIKGTTNVTVQQLRWLQDCHIQETPHKKYRIAQLQQKEHHIIIGGDFNEKSNNNNILQDILSKYVISLNQEETKSTYKRGPHALDKIVASSSLVNPTTQARICEHDMIIQMDHSPISLQIKISGAQTFEHRERLLASTHANKVSKYIKEVYTQMKKQNLLVKIQELDYKTVTQRELNSLDKKFTTIRLVAESKLGKQHITWWHRKVVIWKRELQACNKELKKLMQQRPKPHNNIATTRH